MDQLLHWGFATFPLHYTQRMCGCEFERRTFVAATFHYGEKSWLHSLDAVFSFLSQRPWKNISKKSKHKYLTMRNVVEDLVLISLKE